ncbi:hypothetical protein ACIOYV_02065 [Pseudomonas sp. NPDC087342]|uniref:hypothetical protein n=1 Tax=Pseudomonas sp. NPDC087342 TaxID=3364437 RepID=UPI0038106881
MDELLFEFDKRISTLKEHVDKLKGFLGITPLPKDLRESISTFYERLESYTKIANTSDIDSITQAAKMVAVYGQSIGQTTPSYRDLLDPVTINTSEQLLLQATAFRTFIDENPATYRPLDITSKNTSETFDYLKIKKEIQSISEEQERHDNRIKKSISESESKITLLDEKLKVIESLAHEQIARISSTYDDAVTDTNNKQQQIDDLLGHASGRVIAGDYEKSATQEQFMADMLRWGSLACMLVVTILLGITFWETTESTFQWEKTIFRITLTFLISVPAAYLARESAKRRQQQYQHLQTALDLKALAPFVASLPVEEQHKLKIEIASRVFSAKDFSTTAADPYPLNTHEIMMAIINKLEIPTSKKADENK